jgi:hypothetical protein
VVKTCAVIILSSIVIAGAVYAEKPAIKHALGIKSVAHSAKIKKAVVNLGKPIQAIALDGVLPNGHMSVIVGEGQFAEVLFQPFTRTRLDGDMVSADAVPDRQQMVIWGKWDRSNPNVFKALAVSCRDRLSDIVVRRKIADACNNVSLRRTVASIPDQQRHTVVMTAPAPTVSIPEVTSTPVTIIPANAAAAIARNSTDTLGQPSVIDR